MRENDELEMDSTVPGELNLLEVLEILLNSENILIEAL